MLAAPFIAASLLVVVLGLMAVLIRGDSLTRIGLLCVLATVLPWSAGSAYALTLSDPARVEQVARVYMSSVSLMGPALMFLVLAITRRVGRHRTLLAVATICAATTCVLTPTTNLVVDGTWRTSWGAPYPLSGGPVGVIHVMQFVVWTVLGGVIASRARTRERSERRRVNTGLVVAGLVLATTGASDLLLFYGRGVYPFSAVSAIATLGVFMFALVRQDLMHMRGFDRAGLYELLAAVCVGCGVFTITFAFSGAAPGPGPVLTALATAPLLLLGHVAVTEIRRRSTAAATSDVANETDYKVQAYVNHLSAHQDRDDLARELAAILSDVFRLSEFRLMRVEADQWQTIAGDGPQRTARIDARARAWLVANRSPLVDEELPSRRLGGLRRPIEAVLRSLDAEVLIPLVDRATLVGAIVTSQPRSGRALREDQLAALVQIADATAAALTYADLLEAAEQRVEVARELEVAAAVQRARTPGQERARYRRCDVIRHYHPASSFTGSWWTHDALPDGRVLIAMGEITGQGVPAALVSGSVLGAADTATTMLGGGLDVITFMELVNASLLEIGGETYAMSCFAALFDLDDMRVTFANAAHPAPYRCRGPADDRGRASLRALVSRGTPLGTPEPTLAAATLPLAPGDVVLLHSAPLVRSRSPERVEYGDRRVQHLLRRRSLDAGPDLCERLVEDSLAHYGAAGPEGDVVVFAVHIDPDPDASRESA